MGNIKNLIIFSLIFGAICGLLGLIPIIGVIILLIIIFCSSFIILVFLKKTGNLICPNEQTGLLYGGISGFLAYLGYVCTFLPCAYILSLIFKQSYFTGIGMILKSGFMLTVMLILFVGILCGMMNAFSGLASIYVFNSEDKNKKFTLDINKENK